MKLDFYNHLDGYLYVGMAICTAIVGSLSTTTAEQLLNPIWLFISKSFFEAAAAGMLAAHAYRSNSFQTNNDKQVPKDLTGKQS